MFLSGVPNKYWRDWRKSGRVLEEIKIGEPTYLRHAFATRLEAIALRLEAIAIQRSICSNTSGFASCTMLDGFSCLMYFGVDDPLSCPVNRP